MTTGFCEEEVGHKVAIVGMSLRFPGANNLEEFWSNLSLGVESIRECNEAELLDSGVSSDLLNSEDYVNVTSSYEGIKLFDASFFDVIPKEASIMDPQHRILLECSHEALESAGYIVKQNDNKVGVFVGCGGSSYLINNLLANHDSLNSYSLQQIQFGNEKDHAASRIAYKLNLNGPCLSISTTCSTSLVAVSQAVNSLLAYDCDLAIAGGATVNVPENVGYLYEKESIRSKDGHCRAFDKDASGTVFGSGAGVVVLKRLSNALADNDTIWAVISGVSINNDGADKSGYTAPGVSGQAEAIYQAQQIAGISAEDVTYVEAHGTGTALGDPIEIKALTQAFGYSTKNTGYCGIGSVKSNLGHLDTAAGIAGLIKTALALKHKQLPPTLHFSAPNPEIDFDNSPFYVNTELREWHTQGGPRIAGVSSFGIGGTNAHVILEEAPERETRPKSSKPELFLLSAKSESALQSMVTNLHEYVQAKQSIDFADMAYTLQLGRRSYPHRLALVASDREALLSSLKRQMQSGKGVVASGKGYAYLFPGQGAQDVNMFAQMYATEAVFCDALLECEQAIAGELPVSLTALLYPQDSETELCRQRLTQTSYTQVALFAVEYALSQLMGSWGIKPNMMLGHSVGEYVAACLAGVFSLSDGLRLVLKRGQFMQQCRPGHMLAVKVGADEISALLKEANSQCSIAAQNSPVSSVVSGECEDIRSLSVWLTEKGVVNQVLETSHAFHSQMMEPILLPFKEYVSSIRLEAPTIAFVSNVSGTWITPEEATSPDYWVRHLRGTVQFSQGVNTLLDAKPSGIIEMGPSGGLSAFVQQHRHEHSAVVVSLGNSARQRTDDRQRLLAVLGGMWQAGHEFDWTRLHEGEERGRISLPTYPFERKRYWIEPKRSATSPHNLTTNTIGLGSVESRVFEKDNGNLVPEYSKTENQLVGFCKDLFGFQQIQPEDDFFLLGGDSLLALRLIRYVQETFKKEVMLQDLFSHSQLTSLASLIDNSAQCQELSLPELVVEPQNISVPFPLTEIQRAYFIGRTGFYELGNVGTHTYGELILEKLDVERLNDCINILIGRHEMLRVVMTNDGHQQFLEEIPNYEIEFNDYGHLTEAEQQLTLKECRKALSHRFYSGLEWPIFDIQVSKLREGDYFLQYNFDAMVLDASSQLILFNELSQLYFYPERKLNKLDISFRDYVLAEQRLRDSDVYRQSQDYWCNRVPALPLAPDLPLKVAPGQISRPDFERKQYTLDKTAWKNIKQKCKEFKITPTVFLLGCFGSILQSRSKSPHFILNLTLFNRIPFHEQVKQILGDFTSLTLLEMDFNNRENFTDHLQQIQQQLWQDLEHNLFGGVEVLRKMTEHHDKTIFAPVVFTSTLGIDGVDSNEDELNFYNLRKSLSKSGDNSNGLDDTHGVSQTPQVYLDHQVVEIDDELTLIWDSVEGLFPEGMIEQMFYEYIEFIQRFALGSADFDTDIQTQKTVVKAKRPNVVYHSLLHELVTDNIKLYEAKPAVITAQRTLTFRELDELSNTVAGQLVAESNNGSELVAIVGVKGWEQIVACFGILKSGRAYLPVDAALPIERIQEILKLGQVSDIVTTESVCQVVAFPQGVKLHLIGDDTQRTEHPPRTVRARTITDLAYVIFTSGSSGKPKGVAIEHAGAVNTIVDINQRFAVTERDRVLALSSLSFDLSVYDIFGVLAAGGALVIPGAEELRNPQAFLNYINEHQITIWNTVPALMNILVEYTENQKLRFQLRLVMMSGDWIPLTLPERIRALSPFSRIIGLGGATEASIWSIFYEIGNVDPQWKSIPYGKALTGQKMYVLNAKLDQAPAWVVGEIYIGGLGVAREYWGDEEKTRASFIYHPKTGEYLYKTGDMGRLHPDGYIEFLGREDSQVKIQGFRVELSEIENALNQHENISECVVVAHGERFKDKLLAAYIVLEQSFAKGGLTQGDNALSFDIEMTSGMKEVLLDPHDRMAFVLKQKGVRQFSEAEHKRISLFYEPALEKTLALGEPQHTLSLRSGDEAHLSLTQFGTILAVLRRIELGGLALPKLFYPSTGALYPVQLYVDIPANWISGVASGYYYYNPAKHALVLVRAKSEGGGSSVAQFYLAVDFDAITPMYGYHSGDYSHLEAGYMFELLQATSPLAFTTLPYKPDSTVKEQFMLESSIQVLHRFRFAFEGETQECDFSEVVECATLAHFDNADIAISLSVQSLENKHTLPLSQRQSYREFAQGMLSRESFYTLLSRLRIGLLDATNTLRQSLPLGTSEAVSIQLYIYCKANRVEGLQQGVYLYCPMQHLLRKGDFEFEISPDSYHGVNHPIFNQAAFSAFFVLSGAREQVSNNALRNEALLLTGRLGQQLLHESPRLDIGLCPVGEELDSLLPLTENFTFLHNMLGGKIEAQHKESWSVNLSRVKNSKSSEDVLREYLESRMPSYMVPASFTLLKEIPLTINGKVDRKKLPKPDFNNRLISNFQLPQTELEKKMANIWMKLLNIDAVSINDSFFNVGGNSILIMKLHNELSIQVSSNITLPDLFNYPTIQQLVEHLQGIGIEDKSKVLAEKKSKVARQKVVALRQKAKRK
uniref:Malonyl CoA-acyl carrier protein transacylase n=1 Tax=Rheinheimera sp. BAL341 TaxID=1708203 RepID=A0A486XLT7_9GAMM